MRALLSRGPFGATCVFAVAAALIQAGTAAAAPGDVDAAFGVGGLSTLAVAKPIKKWPEYGDRPTAAATDSNGRTIIVGTSVKNTRGSRNWSIVAIKRNGRVDLTFGDHGHIVQRFDRVSVPRHDSWASGVAVRPNGRILVAGSIDRTTNAEYRSPLDDESDFGVSRRVFALAQYLPSGRLDRSFGKKGVMWIDAVSPKATIESQAQLSGMALLGDGKTVLFGIDDATRAVAYRVTENGRVDGSFGKAGRAIIWHRLWVGGNLIYPGHVAAFPDGRVVYSAQELRCDFSGTPCDRAWRFARTDPSGHLDLAFGDAGTSKLSWSSETQATADLDFGADVTVDAAGGVLASGTVNVAPEGAVVIQRGVVVRLAENGKPDPAFGANGTAVLSPARAADDTTGAGVLSASADGSSFVFSMSCKADATRWLTQPSCSGEDTELHSVVKLSATGAVDPSWGAGGVATAQPTANRVLGRAAAITTASDRLFVASLVYPKSENARDAYGLIALIR